MSGGGGGGGKKIFIITVIVLTLCCGCPVLLAVFAGLQNQQSCDMSAPGFYVDPASVPDGISAGMGTDHEIKTKEQIVNGAIVMQAAKNLNLSMRDQVIGVMVAIGESSLINVDHGDKAGPDSRGIYQQRANGAWGSYTDRMNPAIAATNFFKEMMKVGNRDGMTPTAVGHEVQRNADPNYYAKFYTTAEELVKKLGGVQVDIQPAMQGSMATGMRGMAANSSRYTLNNVKPQTQALAQILGPMFDISAVGGYRQDNVDPTGHPSGLAVDFMVTPDGNTGRPMLSAIPASLEKGQKLADYAQAHAKELGIKYIIWKQQIWKSSQAGTNWRKMEDRGSYTKNHFDHVHISLLADADIAAMTNTSCGGTMGPGGESVPMAALSKTGWANPVEGHFTSGYGSRVHPVTGVVRHHMGTDIGAPAGTPIFAANDGVVTEVVYNKKVAWGIRIDHGDGYQTRYLHIGSSKDIMVAVGMRVRAGQPIARVGAASMCGESCTGSHLHLELKVPSQTNPGQSVITDPAPYFARWGITLGKPATGLPKAEFARKT